MPTGFTLVAPGPAPTRQSPVAGGIAFVWENVADLLAGDGTNPGPLVSLPLTLQDDGSVPLGDVTLSGQAYASTDPRLLPTFDAAGVASGAQTADEAITGTVTLVPFTLTKTYPLIPENELLRGVHDHRTRVDLRIDNNYVGPSTDFQVVDYIPAGLEFLGCGDATADGDHSAAVEYAGAPALNDGDFGVAAGTCPVPVSVDTATLDPDGAGPMANGVYTVVTWDSASLQTATATDLSGDAALVATQSATISYVVGIPEHPNTMTFAGGTPSAASLLQGSNLDNNDPAASTWESATEQSATNYAVLGGQYDDPNAAGGAQAYTDSDEEVVTLEDVAIQKTADDRAILHGNSTTWTLDVQVSEYTTDATSITVVDTVPDGLDVDSSSQAWDSAVINPDGTITVTWTLLDMAAARWGGIDVRTITLDTTTRATYRVPAGEPVRANDSWTNTVTMSADTTDLEHPQRAVFDDSSADQTADPIVLNKEVSAPGAGADPIARCQSASGWVDLEAEVNPANVPGFTPGDEVCWRITYNPPAGLDTTSPELVDFLPPGFAYVDAAETPASAWAVTPDASQEPKISFAFANSGNLASGSIAQLVMATTIDTPSAFTDGQVPGNLAKLLYTNTDDVRYQLRDRVDVLWEEPQLTLDKSASTAGPVAGGDAFTYTIDVANSGSVDATDVTVRDILPSQLACGDVTSSYTVVGTTASVPFGCAAGVIDGTLALVPASGSVSITFEVTVPVAVVPGTTLTNTAGVRTYVGDTNSGGTFTYVPDENIDPGLTPNTDPAGDTADVDVTGATVTKTYTTGVTEGGNTAAQATPGEVVSYTVVTTIPEQTTITGATVTDAVDARFLLDGTSVDAVLAIGAGAAGALPSGWTLASGAADITVTLPTPYAVPAGGATLTVTYDATVRDAGGPSAGSSVPNTAILAATGMTSVSGGVTTPIVEPQVTVTKTETDVDDTVAPGDLIDFTVTAGNAAGASTAHDVVVVDTLPSSMSPTDGAGTVLADGASVPSGGVWDEAARTLTWTSAGTLALGAIAPGPVNDVPLAYQVKVASPIPAPTDFTNMVVATASSLDEDAVGERGPGGVNPTRYTANAEVTLDGPRVLIAKSVDKPEATIGEVVTYTLVATIPANVTTFDATVLDTLPAGMEYLSTSSAQCTTPVAGCGFPEAPQGSVTTLTPSGQSLGWFLGDIQSAAVVDREITIVYTARVADETAVVDGVTLTNNATIASNITDVLGSPTAVTDVGTFTETSTPVAADVDVIEPHVTLVKEVLAADGVTWLDARHITSGQDVTYRITVTNDGNAPAYGVEVSDDWDDRMTGFTPGTGASTVWTSASDGTKATFTLLASLAVDASVTIDYQLTVPTLTSADEVVGPELVNTADATYSSLDGTVDGERSYDDVLEDTVGLEADLGVLGDTVWFDLDGNTTQSGPEFGVSGVPVTVTFLGADGDPGGGDDVVVFNGVTDADGQYLVTGLDEGAYSVVLGTLPAGTSVVYDDDDQRVSPDGVTTVTLTEAAPEYLDADFAIAGSGTVGDLVWLDSDGDGAQAVGGSEPGLAGIDVTVVWKGPDGDVTFTTTTLADGSWSVQGVPAGDLTVTLDAATFPEGVVPVSERDATVDGSVDLAFDGTSDLGYDFGLRGEGSLGDLVWLDVDSDGTQAADATEPGIAGATVLVVWAAPNGGTDAVFTVTTGPDGEYNLGNLPLGDYTVSVTSLPTALAPTYDLDGGVDSPNGTTVVSLTTVRPDEPNADFGYVAATGVGDTVFLDLDGNGAQDIGEPGIPGVEVTVTSGGPDGLLSTTGDNLVVVTTTDADGYYQVLGLPEGETLVEITGGLPGGLTQTYDADGIGSAGSSETDLALDVFDDLQDFGYVGANSIGDTVWVDIDANGVQEAGEPGLPGVTVEVVWLGQDGVKGGDDDIVFLAVTDADGMYLVDGLPDGSYEVAIIDGVPDGYTESYDETDELDGFSVVDGLGADGPESYSTADFGYAGTGAIGGTIWLDRKVDGELDTPAEAGLPGIVVDVTWAGPDGVLGTEDDVVITTETGEGGAWSVEDMPPGPFTAVVDRTTIPEGTVVVWDRANGTSTPDGVYSDTLEPGEVITDIDTAVKGTGSIGDLVWIDSDKNGVRDPNEPAAANVRVVVTWLGGDGVVGGGDDVSIEVRTDGQGIYVADGLPAGRYVVTFDKSTFPKGTAAYADLDGGDPLVTTVTLGIGQVRTDVDLVLRPSSLASTGATVGGLALLVLLLLGGGVMLRRRASAMAARVE